MTELNWDNLRELMVWLSKQDDYNAPYVDGGESSLVIDGDVRRSRVEQFLALREDSGCAHEWADVSIHEVPAVKRAACVKCGSRRIVEG